MIEKRDDFVIANRAYDLFTIAERERVLEIFAGLRYPVIIDRFFEAVHQVVQETAKQKAGGTE